MLDPLVDICRPLPPKTPPAVGSVVLAYDPEKRQGVPPPRFSLRRLEQYEIPAGVRIPYRSPRIPLEEEGVEGAPALKASIQVVAALSAARGMEGVLVGAAAAGLSGEVSRVVVETVLKESNLKKAAGQPTLSALAVWRRDIEPRLRENLERLGLAASDIRVEVWSDNKAETKHLAINLETRPADTRHTVTVTGKVIADPSDTGAEARALFPFTEADLNRFLADSFEREVRTNELDRDPKRVVAALREVVHGWLAKRGYQAARVELTPLFKDALPPASSIQNLPVQVSVRGQQERMTIDHGIQLEREDLLRALANGRPVEEVLAEARRATERLLFNHSYAEIVLAFDEHARGGTASIVQEIGQSVRKVAESCGYRVVHLVSLPKERPNILQRDGVHLLLPEKDDVQGERFELKDVGVFGALKVAVDARLPNLSLIKEWIAPNIDLEQEILKTVRQALATELRSTSAHRFHTEFYSSSFDDGQRGVADTLSGQVAARLEEKFRLVGTAVNVRMGETPLAARFRRLQRGRHEHPFSYVATDENRAGELVNMTVAYTVEGISENGWRVFQGRDFQSEQDELEAISRIIELELRRLLDAVAPGELGSLRTDRLQEAVSKPVRDKVARSLGLDVDVSHILASRDEEQALRLKIGQERRDAIRIQVEAAAKGNVADFNALLEQKRELFNRRKDMIVDGATDEELAPLDAQIAALDARLRPEGSIAATTTSLARPSDAGPKGLDGHLDEILGAPTPRTSLPPSGGAASPAAETSNADA